MRMFIYMYRKYELLVHKYCDPRKSTGLYCCLLRWLFMPWMYPHTDREPTGFRIEKQQNKSEFSSPKLIVTVRSNQLLSHFSNIFQQQGRQVLRMFFVLLLHQKQKGLARLAQGFASVGHQDHCPVEDLPQGRIF